MATVNYYMIVGLDCLSTINSKSRGNLMVLQLCRPLQADFFWRVEWLSFQEVKNWRYNKREIGRRMFTNKRFSISDILRE